MKNIEANTSDRVLARTLCTEINFADLEDISGGLTSWTGCPGANPPKRGTGGSRLVNQGNEVACTVDDNN